VVDEIVLAQVVAWQSPRRRAGMRNLKGVLMGRKEEEFTKGIFGMLLAIGAAVLVLGCAFVLGAGIIWLQSGLSEQAVKLFELGFAAISGPLIAFVLALTIRLKPMQDGSA